MKVEAIPNLGFRAANFELVSLGVLSSEFQLSFIEEVGYFLVTIKLRVARYALVPMDSMSNDREE